MFNIKVFPDFTSSKNDNQKEKAICKELAIIKQNIGAVYVNVSFFDHNSTTTEAVHFLTYPISWISHYITHFYSNVDPLFKIDFRTVSMIDWQDLYRSREQQKLLDNFIENGLGQNGLTIVHHVQQDVYCVLSATFNFQTEKWPSRKLELLEMLRFHADQISEVYSQGYLVRGDLDYKITPREIECLYWVAMGKTDDQISNLLNIGKWTVTGHLQSAKYKLGTPSRSAAVARALTAGIIKLRRAV